MLHYGIVVNPRRGPIRAGCGGSLLAGARRPRRFPEQLPDDVLRGEAVQVEHIRLTLG